MVPKKAVWGIPVMFLVTEPAGHRLLRSLSVHRRFRRFESKLSAPETPMSRPFGAWPAGYVNEKKHSGLLCFLVAGRRIELRTS